ncbi:type II toxin-antitoxin system RatA family toxin [Aestuariivirga litoralis]|uniref:type II toxin-antitoxin system RatA family toxin n=1 Tax=Aestuariivirga litoralis TaxID=2650924 RepID=UPI0018C79698|nr:type II toxin-antitoxin system RatA family toxin [Aestuariivirga litoralis]MBG1231566.1 type II toxin-antitoxin system RatA family toxin [Aestuariivirga litoralis]
MAKVSVQRIVPITMDQAFEIAADVASYKEFIPLVTRSTIRGTVNEEGQVKRFAADLMIAVEKLHLHEGFTSQVVTDAAHRTVVATSQDGPVKDLKAVWTMKPMNGGRSQVSIEIDYHFRNFLLQLAAGRLMDHAVAKVLHAFEERGRKLYPASALPNI